MPGASRPLIRTAALILLAALPVRARAQDAAGQTRTEVLATIRTLFDGMRQADSSKARAVLHPKTLLVSSAERPNGGGPVVSVDPVDGWLKSIGTPHAEVYDERLRNPIVQIEGGLATVWVEYTLYVGARLSHCGVDAFQLAKAAEGWTIVAIADTRRRTGCPEIPPGQ